jgi:hypothetical protein
MERRDKLLRAVSGRAAIDREAKCMAATARICEPEASQHVVARELLLGSLDAKPRLHAIHNEMGSLKSTTFIGLAVWQRP